MIVGTHVAKRSNGIEGRTDEIILKLRDFQTYSLHLDSAVCTGPLTVSDDFVLFPPPRGKKGKREIRKKERRIEQCKPRTDRGEFTLNFIPNSINCKTDIELESIFDSTIQNYSLYQSFLSRRKIFFDFQKIECKLFESKSIYLQNM